MVNAITHVDRWDPTTLPSIPSLLSSPPVGESETEQKGPISTTVAAPFEVTQSAAEWATEQWRNVQLGDVRLDRRAVQMGVAMAAHPAQSLPQQMGSRASLRGAYGLLNHRRLTLGQLSEPHWTRTRQAAGEHQVVLFVQDTTELDYTHHPTKKGLGPIGDGRGRGVLLHSTLGVVPGPHPQVLGLAHQQVVLREPAKQPRPNYTHSLEGQVWARAAEAVGDAPEGVLWVHVGDRGSDDFRFMHACRAQGKHFLIRAYHNRILQWEKEDIDPHMGKLIDFARTLPPQDDYLLHIPAQHKRPPRTAKIHLAWASVTIPPPSRGPIELRHQPPIAAWVVRAWEMDAPPEVEAVEWILITSVPTRTTAQARERTQWYECRWLTEDYHQCLKTGCAIEKRQLDHGDDICRLLGFCGPIATRLLQLRNLARTEPEIPAQVHIDPLTIEILKQRLKWTGSEPVTMSCFWRGVAQLGGHLGRRGDGPPGWKTIWRGWQYLQDLVTGARLCVVSLMGQQVPHSHPDSNAAAADPIPT
jgi:hypothetical protein